MKYAVIADVHGNLEAFMTVLDAVKGIDRFIFAGDIVGYGPDPNECIDILRGLDPISVAGNHDKAVSDDIGIDFYRKDILDSINWTKNALSAENLQYLRGLPEQADEPGFQVVHGSLRSPLDEYITNVQTGSMTIEMMKRKSCFVGHLHIPLYIFKDKKGGFDGWQLGDGDKIDLSKPEKAIINPGAVGQPRDSDPKASFGIFDEEKGTFELRRIGYDIEAVQKKIRKAGLPDHFAERLKYGR